MDYPLSAAEPGGDAKTLPDRIVDHFIAQIFTGRLTPGERLPGDRELAPLLGVDRTSLRVAMQQLARMGVLRVVHGSGVRVLDFRETAGLDFLAAVFALPGLWLGSGYLLQILDDWIDLLPVFLGRALARATSREVLELDALMVKQLEVLDAEGDLTEVAAGDVALEDRVLRMLGNTSAVLLGNSSRALRLKLMTMFFETIDARRHVATQRRLLADVVAKGPVSATAITQVYRVYLEKVTVPLRKKIQGMPLNPSLITAPKRSRPRAPRPAARSRAAR